VNFSLIHRISAAGFSPEAGAGLYDVLSKAPPTKQKKVRRHIRIGKAPKSKKSIGVQQLNETPIQAFHRVF
jgi:hypothetical protein